MTAPGTELQTLIVDRLENGTGLTGDLVAVQAALSALVANRLESNPRDDIGFPYIRLGRQQTLEDDETCVEVNEYFQNLHCYSREGGWDEAREVAHLVWKLLHEADVQLVEHGLRFLRVSGTEDVDDPDARTVQVVVKIEASVEIK